MNAIIFKQIIQDAIVEDFSEEMILCLLRAGMVVTIVNAWKTFDIARDSSDAIGNAMKSTLKTATPKNEI